MVENFSLTSSGTRTIVRRQKTVSIVTSDARGIDLRFNSNNRICSLWSNNRQARYCGNGEKFNNTESANTRYNHVITIQNGTVKFYVNNVLKYTGSISTGLTSQYFRRGQEYNNAYPRQLHGYLKDIIIENKVRSDSDRTKYYNDYKGEYDY